MSAGYVSVLSELLSKFHSRRADRTYVVRQGDVKDAVKDAGSTIKDKVSGAADDAEDAAKSTSAYLAFYFF